MESQNLQLEQESEELECENCQKQIKICSNCKKDFYSQELMWCWNNGQHHYCSCNCVFTNEIIKDSKSIIKLKEITNNEANKTNKTTI